MTTQILATLTKFKVFLKNLVKVKVQKNVQIHSWKDLFQRELNLGQISLSRLQGIVGSLGSIKLKLFV